MASDSDPTPLPQDAIQRVLFIASTVHIYNIPPLTNNKGYTAAQWTADNNKRQIFTARLRIIETAIPLPDGSGESLSTEILLEDPSNAELFAKAPYTDPRAVESVLDSSRFFAIRVVGDGGMKATLGIGFEERAESIDFGICLQECRKVLGMEPKEKGRVADKPEAQKKDYGLKEGQTIKVDIGKRGRRRVDDGEPNAVSSADVDALFSIKPPPAPPPPYTEKSEGVALPLLAPPPSASEMRAEKRRSRGFEIEQKTAADLGFDDGEFGEFQ
ncbi:adaptin ear-binding coat-associated protein 1/2, partial [Lecanoromycetidae sp. Uapishka_2]